MEQLAIASEGWFGGSPVALAGFIIVVSYILEDAAVIMAALLVVAGHLTLELAMCSAVIGLVSGDAAIYAIGRSAHRYPAAGRWINRRPRLVDALRRVRHSHWMALIAMRFVPGMRVAGFAACGLARMSVQRFLFINVIGAILWTSLVLGLFLLLDSSAQKWLGPMRWGLIAAAVLVLFMFSHRLWRKPSA